MAVQIQIRRDTTQNWYEINPILAKGEMGIEYLDNGKTKIKIGNGVDTYSNLEYFADTINYYDIINKPQINNIELNGNVSLIDLGIQPIGNYALYEDVVNGLALKADIDNTYSKSDIDTFFNNLLKIPAIEDQEGKYLKVLQGEIVWSDITGDIVSIDKLNEELDKKVDKIDGYSLISISELERLAGVSNYDDQPIKEDLELLKEEVDTKASINSLNNYVLKNDLTDTLDEYALKSDISSKAEASDLISHISNTLNPHKVTKEQIGLGNVNNTSDINKPISIAMQTALNEKQDNLTTGYGISIENNVITNTVPNVQSDWLAEEGNAVIINKPNLATVATSGSYNDLEDKPVIPSEYVLPIASSSQLGGIKVGSGLAISGDGTLSSTTSGGTTDYTALSNKPQINSVELSGNKSLDDLGIQAKGEYALKSELANKADTSAIPTKVSQLQNDSNFLTSVPAEYVTETELNGKGFITESELNETYATKVELAEKADVTALNGKANKSTTLNGYGITDAYTKTDADGKYATKAQGTKADTAVQPATLEAYVTTETANSTYATKVELGNKADTSALEAKADKETTLAGYGITDAYTKVTSDGKYALKTELANKADTSALANYATTESLSQYALKSELTSSLAEKANKSTTLAGYGITDAYTQTEINGKLANKADTSALSAYATTASVSSTYLSKTEATSTYATTENMTTELNKKADKTSIPAATSLMSGTAPTVQDIDGDSVTEISALIEALNAILAQLRTRGVIA